MAASGQGGGRRRGAGGAESVDSPHITRTTAAPNIDALWKAAARETDKKKREALLQRIQQIAFERVRFAAIWDYVWPSGVGPRVAERSGPIRYRR